MFNLIWNFIQQRNIDELQKDSMDANVDVSVLTGEVNRLKKEVASLTLTASALCEILSDKLQISEQEIIDKITEIDLRDGTLDGRITPNGQKPR